MNEEKKIASSNGVYSVKKMDESLSNVENIAMVDITKEALQEKEVSPKVNTVLDILLVYIVLKIILYYLSRK